MEEVELRADPPVVAPARALEPLEVRVEVLLGVEGGAVDARQLLVVGVAAPVRAGEAGQLERLDRLRVLQVRPAAEIGEVALRIDRDVALGGVDELELVRIGREELLGLVTRDLLPHPLAALGELAVDLGLDLLQILLADRLREVEVVVEAVLDRRPDRELHARIELRHGLREQVRGRVTEDGERIRVVLVADGQDLDRLAVVQRQAQILHASVRAQEHSLLGELRPDRSRGVQARSAVGKFEL